MIRRVMLGLLAPLAVQAQLALFSFDGTTETPVGGVYNFGNVGSNDSKDVRFRARNTGNSAVSLTTLSVSGSGFTIRSVNGSVPGTIAPNNFLEFTVRFSAGTPASYSASLQVNTINVFLLATVVPEPTLTVFPVCTVDPGTGAINFGNFQNGVLRLCNFYLQNRNAQALIVSTLTVTGAFQGPSDLSAPFTLAPGQTVAFIIQVTAPCGTRSVSGALIVNTHSYPLSGTSFVPLLPKPSLTFDSNIFASGEQHKLTLSLPSPYPCTAAGYVNIVFTPRTNLADDAAVIFIAGSARSLPFSVTANGTQISINGQPSAVFQTGTTEGRITFTVTTTGVQIDGDPTTILAIPAAAVSIDTASASNQRLGNLDIQVIGFDNTYTAGVMSFTFLDSSGKVIGVGAVNADFTAAFRSYFSSQKSGSAFLMRVSFPVTGDQKQVSSVKLTLTNAAGQSQTGTLMFQ